jgi:CHAD domain-containing protein
MAATANGSSLNGVQKKLFELSQKRLEKFAALFPSVLIRDDPETIHDARVGSRRLQQVFRILFPKPAPKKCRKLVRVLRKVRRALGDCRNHDVMEELIQEKIAASGNPVVRDAWDQLKVQVQEKQKRELIRARAELSQCDIVDFVNGARHLLASAEWPEETESALTKSITRAFEEWTEAVHATKESPTPEQVHALRIAGKRLRYRVELLAELGDEPAKARTKTLKILQDQLGQWHDHHVLVRLAAKFLSKSDFLVAHPDLSRALLVEMERERRRNDTAVSNILKSAEKIRDAWAEAETKPAPEISSQEG